MSLSPWWLPWLVSHSPPTSGIGALPQLLFCFQNVNNHLQVCNDEGNYDSCVKLTIKFLKNVTGLIKFKRFLYTVSFVNYITLCYIYVISSICIILIYNWQFLLHYIIVCLSICLSVCLIIDYYDLFEQDWFHRAGSCQKLKTGKLEWHWIF